MACPALFCCIVGIFVGTTGWFAAVVVALLWCASQIIAERLVGAAVSIYVEFLRVLQTMENETEPSTFFRCVFPRLLVKQNDDGTDNVSGSEAILHQYIHGRLLYTNSARPHQVGQSVVGTYYICKVRGYTGLNSGWISQMLDIQIRFCTGWIQCIEYSSYSCYSCRLIIPVYNWKCTDVPPVHHGKSLKSHGISYQGLSGSCVYVWYK